MNVLRLRKREVFVLINKGRDVANHCQKVQKRKCVCVIYTQVNMYIINGYDFRLQCYLFGDDSESPSRGKPTYQQKSRLFSNKLIRVYRCFLIPFRMKFVILWHCTAREDRLLHTFLDSLFLFLKLWSLILMKFYTENLTSLPISIITILSHILSHFYVYIFILYTYSKTQS